MWKRLDAEGKKKPYAKFDKLEELYYFSAKKCVNYQKEVALQLYTNFQSQIIHKHLLANEILQRISLRLSKEKKYLKRKKKALGKE